MWQLHIGSHSGPSWSASFRFVPVRPLLTCKNIHAAAREKNSHSKHISRSTLPKRRPFKMQWWWYWAITIRWCQNNHFAHCSLSVILIGLIFAWWWKAVLEQPACSVGVVLLSTSKVVPYHTKKLAMWHKLVSNQRIFKMCARKRAFLLIKTFIP